MINLCRGLKYLKKLVLAKDKKRPEALVETIIEHNKFIQVSECTFGFYAFRHQAFFNI